jgi:electron transfer flavoprotein beta subunit
MHIVVTLKQVPDPNIPPQHLQIDATGKQVTLPFGVPAVMNGYDANALEEALRLKEKHGGRVTAVALGGDSSREALKRAIAMGADKAVLLNDPTWAGADSAGVGGVLAAAIRKVGEFDLILCGRQASDTDGGQVLHWIAETLKVASVSPVVKIEEVADHSLIVRRMTEGGYQRLRVEMPALLGISSEINEPRFPSPRGTMAAGRALIAGWKAADVGVGELAPRVELQRLAVQRRTSSAVLIQGESGKEQGAALADKLHEMGVV